MTADNTEFRRLQAQYVSDFDAMDTDDLKAFLALLQADSDAPYRESRIRKIERKLDGLGRAEQTREQREEEWKRAAYEDKAIKERWLELGATWECRHILTTWSYEGAEFYRWWGGFNRPKVTEEIVNVRKADERLTKLIADKEAVATV